EVPAFRSAVRISGPDVVSTMGPLFVVSPATGPNNPDGSSAADAAATAPTAGFCAPVLKLSAPLGVDWIAAVVVTAFAADSTTSPPVSATDSWLAVIGAPGSCETGP